MAIVKTINLEETMIAGITTSTNKIFVCLSNKALLSLDSHTLRATKVLTTQHVINKLIDYREQYLFLVSYSDYGEGYIEVMDFEKNALIMKYQV